MRKADISTGAMVSIVIAIAGIVIILGFISDVIKLPKSIYCDTLYKFSKEKNVECEKGIEIVKVKNQLFNISSSRVLYLNNESKETSIKIPVNAEILNADAKIMGKRQSLFTKINGSMPVTINPPFNFTINVPIEEKITSAELVMLKPKKNDIVFIVDSSESMNDEFSDICNNLINTIRERLGIRSFVYVYSLGERTFCANENIDKKKMENVTKIDLFTGKEFHQKYKTEIDSWLKELNSSLQSIGDYYISDIKDPSKPLFNNLMTKYNNYKNKILPFDEYNEAWGLGALYAIRKYRWRSDSIKFLFIITDTDPTGGGLVPYSLYQNDAMFSGNEENIANRIVNEADKKNITVVVMYGNEEKRKITLKEIYYNGNIKEGFNIDDVSCIGMCKKLRDIMKKATHNKLMPYKERWRLFELFNKDITEKIHLKTDGIENEININSTPLNIKLKELIGKNGNITFKFLADKNITATINYLRIVSEGPLKDVTVKIKDLTVASYNQLYTEKNIILKNQIKRILKECDDFMCEVPLNVSAKKGNFMIKFNVTYNYCPLGEYLSYLVLNCKKKKDICYELAVPETCKIKKKIKEKYITQFLSDNGFCNTIQNNFDDINKISLECGKKNNLVWTKDIYSLKNFLIENNKSAIIVR